MLGDLTWFPVGGKQFQDPMVR